MIIKGLLTLITNIIGLIPFEIPSLPDNFTNFMEQFKSMISNGAAFISSIMPYDYMIILLEIFIGIELALHLYKFVMWVIRKIPMAGISD